MATAMSEATSPYSIAEAPSRGGVALNEMWMEKSEIAG